MSNPFIVLCPHTNNHESTSNNNSRGITILPNVPIKQLECSHHYNHFEMLNVVKPASSAPLKSLKLFS